MALSHSPKIVTDGLVLCLDAGDGKSYSGSGTTWTDRSGNGNHGTLTNGPTFDSANGGSIEFDGVNDYVIGSSNLGISGDAEFTIAYWGYWGGSSFNTSNYPSGVGNNSTGAVNKGLSTTWRDGKIALDFWGNRFRATTRLTVQTWYYVGFTKTAGLIFNTSKLYVNGQEVAGAGEANNVAPNITDTPFVVGRLDGTRWFDGKISNVKIYNKALTAAEILQNYNAQKGRFS